MAISEYSTIAEMFKHFKDEAGMDDDVAAAILTLAHVVRGMPFDLTTTLEEGIKASSLDVNLGGEVIARNPDSAG